MLTREAEDSGFSHVFIPEGTNDSLMCAYAVARATSRINIVTYTSNIYFREPSLRLKWFRMRAVDALRSVSA